MEKSRPVIVKRVPDHLNHRQARKFITEIRPFLETDRPQLVLDLSPVRQLDAAGVDMLLYCMKEATKRDGDVKLSSPSDQASIVLELTRTGRLFEIYESSTEAVRSFSAFLPNMLKQFHPSPSAVRNRTVGERKAA